MNITWKTICIATEETLFGEKKEYPQNVDWNEVFLETKNQAITSIVYKSVVLCLPENINAEWQLYNFQTISHAMQVIHEENELICLMKKQDIPLCILKGTAAAIYYPDPLLRTMGDIDFIISENDFSVVKDLLISNGYVLDKKEEDNPRHIVFLKNGVLFEMHHYFADEKIDAYIFNQMSFLERGIIRNHEFPMLPSLENGIILLEHLRQHLVSGIGIRHFLDWMMYVSTILDDVFWKDFFESEVNKLGLRILAIHATRLCQIYFGLSKDITWCNEADDSVCERLMDNIIQSGNFGKRLGDGKNIEKTVIRLKKGGYFRYIQKAGEYNWKALKKHHWLKPFAWIYQLGRYTKQLFRIGKRGASLRDNYNRSKERYRLLTDLGIMNNDL